MKNISKIFLLLTFALFTKSYAQLDTLNYIKQFEANKSNYIGQPFSKLLNDMVQIQPKTVMPILSFKPKNYTLKSTFYFCEKEGSFSNAITLEIEWQNPIPRTDTKYYEGKNNFYFTTDEKIFYSSKIVKNIKVYR